MNHPACLLNVQDCGVHVAMFSSKWFVTLFSNLDTLPLKTVLRVWDVFFVERCGRGQCEPTPQPS